jgi:hypothetical protein
VLDHSRSPIAARAGTWQLVDGKQRITAMVALFADDPAFERYFLDMVGQRWWDESLVTQTKGRARATSYIQWRRADHEAESCILFEQIVWTRVSGPASS